VRRRQSPDSDTEHSAEMGIQWHDDDKCVDVWSPSCSSADDGILSSVRNSRALSWDDEDTTNLEVHCESHDVMSGQDKHRMGGSYARVHLGLQK